MGHHNRHFAGDRFALHGAWGPPNSKANFCEEDYAVSRYLAEFINSLTNLAYVYFAIRNMYGPKSLGLFRPTADFMSISLLVLGIASFLFHASLRQNLQFADELSMLGLTWSFLQGLLTVGNSPRKSKMINFSLAIAFSLFSLFYVWNGTIIYHVAAFASTILLIILRGLYLFHWRQPAFPKAKLASLRTRRRRALASLLFGYLLWNIDLEYCVELRNLRAQVGMPWSWLFELHGWWHVLTAISANSYLQVLRDIREEAGNIETKKIT